MEGEGEIRGELSTRDHDDDAQVTWWWQNLKIYNDVIVNKKKRNIPN